MRPLSVSPPTTSGRGGGGANGHGNGGVGSPRVGAPLPPPPPFHRRRIQISPKHIVLGALLFVVGFGAMRHQGGGGRGGPRAGHSLKEQQQQRHRKGAFADPSSSRSPAWNRFGGGRDEGMLPGMGGIRSEEADAAAAAVSAQAAEAAAAAAAGANGGDSSSSSSSSSQAVAPSAKSCSELLNAPKVALMFLTRGEMPHEPAWAAWLHSARGLVPLPVAAAPGFGGCGAARVAELVAACGSGVPSGGAGGGGGGDSLSAAASTAALLRARTQGQRLAEASSITGMAREAERAKLEEQAKAAAAASGGVQEVEASSSTSSSTSSSSSSSSAAASNPNPNPIVTSQHLFSVYVHAPPDFAGYQRGSVFERALLPAAARVAASWGGHDLVDAARALLRAALSDPLNERFVLLSESGAPTMAPSLVYMQLLGSRLSRINACEGENNDDWRWHPAMARPLEKKEEERKKKGTQGGGDESSGGGDGGGDGGGGEGSDDESGGAKGATSPEEAPDASTFVPEEKWRKSSQWASLTRKHAAAVAADTAIDSTFRSVCHFREWDAELERKYLCFSDEHYIPTLLAIRGWDSETDCFGYNVHTDWTEGGPHPKSYTIDEVTPEKMAWLRDGWGDGECHASTAAAAARALVVPAASLSEPTCAATAALARGRRLDLDAAVDARDPSTAPDDAPFRDAASRATAALATAALLSSWSDRLLPKECPLFARKFPAEVSAKLAEVLGDCDVAAYGHEACDPARAVEREAGARKGLEKKLAGMRKKRKTTDDRDEKPR